MDRKVPQGSLNGLCHSIGAVRSQLGFSELRTLKALNQLYRVPTQAFDTDY